MTIHAVPRADEERPAHVFDVVARVQELADRKKKLEEEIAAIQARLDAVVEAATGTLAAPAPKTIAKESRRETVVPAQTNVGGTKRMDEWISKREGSFRAADLASGANVTTQFARTHIFLMSASALCGSSEWERLPDDEAETVIWGGGTKVGPVGAP